MSKIYIKGHVGIWKLEKVFRNFHMDPPRRPPGSPHSPPFPDPAAGPDQPAEPPFDDFVASLFRAPSTTPEWRPSYPSSPSPPPPQRPAYPAAPGPRPAAPQPPDVPTYWYVPRAATPDAPPAPPPRPRRPAALKASVHKTPMPSGSAGANRPAEVLLFSGSPQGTRPRQAMPAQPASPGSSPSDQVNPQPDTSFSCISCFFFLRFLAVLTFQYFPSCIELVLLPLGRPWRRLPPAGFTTAPRRRRGESSCIFLRFLRSVESYSRSFSSCIVTRRFLLPRHRAWPSFTFTIGSGRWGFRRPVGSSSS